MITITELADQEIAQLLTVSDTLRDALGVTASVPQLAALEKEERRRLVDLCRKLRSRPEGPQVPSLDQRAQALAFADGVEGLSRMPGTSKRLRREQKLLAEYVRQVEFVPSAAERLVFRGVAADVTLDDLRSELARVAPEWRGPRFSWGELADGEAAELEGLVEKALAEPGLFAERRSESGSRLHVGLLARRAEDGAAQRSRLPEGWVPIPPGLLDDVHRGDVLAVDVAVLVTVVLTLQARRIHPARERHARFDGGDALVVEDGGRALLPDWDPGADLMGRSISATFPAILDRLARRRWLEVEPSGKAVRIRLGERLTVDGAA